MNTTSTFTVLVILFGRMLIPLVLTALVVYWLHRMDVRWRAEAERERNLLLKNDIPCWIEQGLSIEESRLRAAASEKPCWQANREQNGHMLEACLECDIFLSASQHDAKKKYSHAHV